MSIYKQKKRWKILLFIIAVLIVTGSLWYSNIMVRKIAEKERQNISIWADAVQRRADLVTYTQEFFKSIEDEERKRVELLAEATQRLVLAENSEELTFYSEIISGNTTIPVIQTDAEGNIIGVKNIDFDTSLIKKLEGELQKEFSIYEPVTVDVFGNISYLYYKDSRTYTEIRAYLDDLVQSFISEVVLNSVSVPVIITDSTRKKVLEYGNLDPQKMKEPAFLSKTIEEMSSQHDPIVIDFAGQGKRYIFWKDSYLLTRLRFYPVVQFGIIGVFLLIAYLLFSTARKSEQNQVWVGMSKETAHQLGTPLSSMMAWIELLRLKQMDNDIILELEKDIQRLEIITDRFSKIGSPAKLIPENIVKVIYDSIDYLKPRTSKKIIYKVNLTPKKEIIAPLNIHLFEWVIENLCKNAIDAMNGVGSINIDITEDNKHVYVDITDTGKGIQRANHKDVFNPGFTSKKRGWGLGLSLSQRIIRDYHKGRIYVKQSVIDKGTTFRIALRK
ncbi:MAG: HAMP domain-containing sensor histidine kinase [Bacteroidetes bacterium]|nr:HAMP domain-containing sensor histidine kinase [Bacteroidota bacterium]